MRAAQPMLVKRYARSRLYDTRAARYVSLDELRDWRARGVAFEVRDAETGEEISRILLT
jgi:polyhydroxyalkanoate synthesis regulator protein